MSLDTRISVRLDPVLGIRLAVVADDLGCTVSQIARRILEEGLTAREAAPAPPRPHDAGTDPPAQKQQRTTPAMPATHCTRCGLRKLQCRCQRASQDY